MEIQIDPTLRDASAEDEDVIRRPDDALLVCSSFARRSLAHSVVYEGFSQSLASQHRCISYYNDSFDASYILLNFWVYLRRSHRPHSLFTRFGTRLAFKPTSLQAGGGRRQRTPDSARDHP